MIILDTNVVSEPLRPRPDEQFVAWLDAQALDTLYLTTISLSELLTGVGLLPLGKRRTTLAADLQGLLDRMIGARVLGFDKLAAEHHAALMVKARQNGLGLSVADSYIAAIALSRGFAVASRDISPPFKAAGVEVINPWTA